MVEVVGKRFELIRELEVIINGEIVGFLPKGFTGTILSKGYERPTFQQFILIQWDKEGMAETGMRDWEEKIKFIS